MTFKFNRPLRAPNQPRHEGCTVHKPDGKLQCWGVVQRGKWGKLTQPMQCMSKARHGKRTCYVHRKLEDEAWALRDGRGEAEDA